MGEDSLADGGFVIATTHERENKSATQNANNWVAVLHITSIIGGFVAAAYLGYFQTTWLFSGVSILADMEGQASPPVHGLLGPFSLSETSDEVMYRTDSNVTDTHGAPAAAWAVSVPYCRPVRLAWKDLAVSVNGGQFLVLDGVTGHSEPNRLLAIMGPSGSEKS
ncbi:unnamed protein product [Calypogeia fissa]